MVIVKTSSPYQTNRFLRSKEVTNITGLSRTTIWRLESIGEFPSRKRLSAGTVGYLLSEVDNWVSERQAVVNA